MSCDRIRELEREFIIWSNILDDELMKYNSRAVDSYTSQFLLEEDSFFHDLLEEFDSKNKEYLKLIGNPKLTHPNYEKLDWRINLIIEWINYEIRIRSR
jgi:hypothetical protein